MLSNFTQAPWWQSVFHYSVWKCSYLTAVCRTVIRALQVGAFFLFVGIAVGNLYEISGAPPQLTSLLLFLCAVVWKTAADMMRLQHGEPNGNTAHIYERWAREGDGYRRRRCDCVSICECAFICTNIEKSSCMLGRGLLIYREKVILGLFWVTRVLLVGFWGSGCSHQHFFDLVMAWGVCRLPWAGWVELRGKHMGFKCVCVSVCLSKYKTEVTHEDTKAHSITSL